MTETLSPEGYEQTKAKLLDLEKRLSVLEARTDLSPEHLASVKRSYKMMMREFLREIKLFEARHASGNTSSFPPNQ
jgi:hypothetical protein